jgi:magnesium-dependent phosphatase 1
MKYQIIVFDLDFTLWNAGGTWCDQTCPPYKRVNEAIYDSENNKITLYPDVFQIIRQLTKRGYTLGLASRTYEPSWANKLLDLFEIGNYFNFKEIYPSSKKEHFLQIRNKSKVPYNKMIFFDDELRNIEDVEKLGVKSVLVRNGITYTHINSLI